MLGEDLNAAPAAMVHNVRHRHAGIEKRARARLARPIVEKSSAIYLESAREAILDCANRRWRDSLDGDFLARQRQDEARVGSSGALIAREALISAEDAGHADRLLCCAWDPESRAAKVDIILVIEQRDVQLMRSSSGELHHRALIVIDLRELLRAQQSKNRDGDDERLAHRRK